jgi:sugar lactone lactonase YvrE
MGRHHLKKTSAMSTSNFKVLFDTPMLLGESPLWHPHEAALYWIDIAGKSVHRFHPGSGAHHAWPVPAEPGCIARCADGGLIVAMRSGIAMLDTISGALTWVADAPYDPSAIRFNDGRCDAAGRLWVGTLCDARDQPRGALYCVERGVIRHVGNPVTVSNGLAFSIDSRILFHADTTAHRIMAYDFDLTRAQLSNGRLFQQFSTERSANYGGRPDGAAVDSEDAYWCAMYEGARLLRISPAGELLQEIALPVRCPTMIAFGGDDLRTLYITTVRNGRPEAELQQHPLSGHVLTLRVDVPGRIEPSYIR